MKCEYEPNASYLQLLNVTYKFYENFFKYLNNPEQSKRQIQTWFPIRFSFDEYLLICILIFCWYLARKWHIENIGISYCDLLQVSDRNRNKTIECLWSLSGDFFLWIYAFFLIQQNSNQCNLFRTPSDAFRNISPNNNVEFPVKLFYLLYLSKYSFNIYAVLYLDEKRKDFPVMIMHHLVTLILLSISYVSRTAKTGIIVLFIHNVCDLFLMAAKISLNSKPRTSFGCLINKTILYLFALIFTITWIVNRLYLYPLRAIYYANRFPLYSPDGRILGIAYSLLFAIFLMDIYWTYYIGKFLWRLFAKDQVLYDPRILENKKEIKTS